MVPNLVDVYIKYEIQTFSESRFLNSEEDSDIAMVAILHISINVDMNGGQDCFLRVRPLFRNALHSGGLLVNC